MNASLNHENSNNTKPEVRMALSRRSFKLFLFGFGCTAFVSTSFSFLQIFGAISPETLSVVRHICLSSLLLINIVTAIAAIPIKLPKIADINEIRSTQDSNVNKDES